MPCSRPRLTNAAAGMLRKTAVLGGQAQGRAGGRFRSWHLALGALYRDFLPGKKGQGVCEYAMLDRPLLASLMPGDCGCSLSSRDANALGAGSPSATRGFTIGRVEEAKFLPEKKMQYQLFINAPYDVLVSSNSRFWLTPGFEVSMEQRGMKAKMDSLRA